MLVYEENRTEDIVKQLVMIAKGLKFLVIFFSIIIFAGIVTTSTITIGRLLDFVVGYLTNINIPIIIFL